MTIATNPNFNQSPLDLFGLVGSSTQNQQDAELIRQLPFVPGLKEFLMLRQVHALEHATVWVLSESNWEQSNQHPADNELLGGLSTDKGFYLYGQVSQADLRYAVGVALQRLTNGDGDLAVHPRCGTNLSVGMLLAVGLFAGIHLLLPRGPIEQVLGLGIAATTAAQLTPELGTLAQRYITTAIPFNLVVERITLTRDVWGKTANFVQVRWRE